MKSIARSLVLTAAFAAQWDILENNFDTIILAVAFADTKNGIVPYDDNGSGAGVKVTTDGGQTWTQGQVANYTSLLIDAAFVGKNAVMSGFLDTQFSSDGGNTFNMTKSDKIFASQNCESISGRTDDQFFGLAGGTVAGGNGVAISTDAGKTSKFYNISIAQTMARYGAFPSRQVWYIAAGQFPQTETNDATLVRELSRRVHHRVDKTGRKSVKLQYTPIQPTKTTPSNYDFAGQILKTADGGATWTSQFFSTDFYFNEIDCEDENKCCAVGESDAGSAPGARIYCTSNGANWTQVYFASGAEHSLFSVRSVPGSAGEWIAGGGDLPSQFNITGTFPHSTDGGKTWNVETLKKVYVTDLSIVDTNHGWGSTIEQDEQSGLIIYK